MKLNKRAFSLLEAFLALAICAGLLMTVVSVVNYHLKVIIKCKQRDGLYAVAGNMFELIKKKSINGQGRLAEPFADYSYQANLSDAPYQGIELLTMKITGPKEEFTFSEYTLGITGSNGRNDNKS